MVVMHSTESTLLASSPKLPPEMAPGGEAPAGARGVRENVCRMCAGTGRIDGHMCPDCEGSGKVIEGIGGGP
jgi:hypothetical protein